MEKYYLAALAYYLGYAAAHKALPLVKCYGSAQAAHQAGLKVLPFLQLTPALENAYRKRYDRDLPCALKHYSEDNKVEIITQNDATYPLVLRETYDAPVVLYAKGQSLSNVPKLALVGSRKASSYGLEVAEQFAQILAAAGLTIVSGGAYGIDAAAHRGALRAKGHTIVVLGGGLDNLYPVQHKKLFHEVMMKGTLLTEYAPWETAQPYHFPLRNRIIVGLCQGVLIVEAAKKSGAMITANLAVSENREVYAIPGSIKSPTSQGTNGLIKEGAHLVDNPQDILADFILPQKLEQNLFESLNSLKPLAKNTLELIKRTPGISLEEIILKLDLTLSSVSGILLELQLGGHIIQEEHNCYRAI